MRRELQTEQMRRRILDSALEVFGAEGYDGASMNAICTRAGISKGIIYHYFAAMPFALLALGLLLCRLLEARPRAGRAACVGALALAAGLFVFFFPVLSGLPVSTSYAALLKWLPGWGFYIL